MFVPHILSCKRPSYKLRLKRALCEKTKSTIAMSLSEFEIKKCERSISEFMLARRPPPHIRDQLDFGYRIENQSVLLFEIRPDWQDSKKKMETSIAKATYVKRHNHWKVYWERADLKWHSYEPYPIAKTVSEFLSVVSEDQYACFFG